MRQHHPTKTLILFPYILHSFLCNTNKFHRINNILIFFFYKILLNSFNIVNTFNIKWRTKINLNILIFVKRYSAWFLSLDVEPSTLITSSTWTIDKKITIKLSKVLKYDLQRVSPDLWSPHSWCNPSPLWTSWGLNNCSNVFA